MAEVSKYADPHEALADAYAEIATLRSQLAEAKAELKMWKPMTMEEAEAAYDAAESVPISHEEIEAIVAKITDPAYRPSEPERIKLVAKNRQLEKQLAEANDRLSIIQASVAEGGGDIEKLLAIGMLGKLTTLIGNARHRQLCEAEEQLAASQARVERLEGALQSVYVQAIRGMTGGAMGVIAPHSICVSIKGLCEQALNAESEASDER